MPEDWQFMFITYLHMFNVHSYTDIHNNIHIYICKAQCTQISLTHAHTDIHTAYTHIWSDMLTS